MPDYLALVGDAADGIPGISAWGAKSASTLLARYSRIERIPLDPGEWDVKVRGAARLAGSLAANIDDALFYRTLTTLRRDVPIAETIDDLRWEAEDTAAIEALGL
jgi:5'-3' exonuclease